MNITSLLFNKFTTKKSKPINKYTTKRKTISKTTMKGYKRKSKSKTILI